MSFVLLALLAAGCGAMRNGPQQRVRITTIPPGAVVRVGGETHTAPAVVTLDRDRSYTVQAEAPGFEPARAEIHSVPDEDIVMLNCLLLCIPQLWEAGEASQFKLEPREVDIQMNPIGWSPR